MPNGHRAFSGAHRQGGSIQVSSLEHESLFMAAVRAAESLPVVWRREQQRLIGTLDREHGTYIVSIFAHPRLFDVRIAVVEAVADDATEQIGLLCAEANRTLPTASFYLSGLAGGAVQSAATIALDLFDDVPEARLLGNVLEECLQNAELIAPMIGSVNHGRTVADAMRSGLDALAGRTTRPNDAPVSDVGLIDACCVATHASGWETLRRNMTQMAVVCSLAGSGEQAPTFVEAHEGSLHVSAYILEPKWRVPAERRSAVAELLNQFLDLGAPFGLSLDRDTGDVRTRSFLDIRGLAAVPPRDLLRDVIFQAGGGALIYLDAIRRVAHEGVDPAVALADHRARYTPERRTA
jgi:hypothetical protein